MDDTLKSEGMIAVEGGTLVVLSPDTGLPIGEPVVVDAEHSVIIGRGRHCQIRLEDLTASTSPI